MHEGCIILREVLWSKKKKRRQPLGQDAGDTGKLGESNPCSSVASLELVSWSCCAVPVLCGKSAAAEEALGCLHWSGASFKTNLCSGLSSQRSAALCLRHQTAQLPGILCTFAPD